MLQSPADPGGGRECDLARKCAPISDNWPQFIAKHFKEFIRIRGHDPSQNFALLSSIERTD